MKRSLAINPLLFIILCIVILLGGILYAYLAVIQPMNGSIQHNLSKAHILQQQAQTKAAQIQKAKSIHVDNLIREMPSTPRLDNYILVLHQLGESTHCQIKNINLTKTSGNMVKPSQSVKSVPLTLDLSAPDFHSMKLFVDDLEHLERITHVTGLKYQLSKQVNDMISSKKSLSFQVSLSIYYDPQVKALDHGQGLLPFGNPAHKTSPF